MSLNLYLLKLHEMLLIYTFDLRYTYLRTLLTREEKRKHAKSCRSFVQDAGIEVGSWGSFNYKLMQVFIGTNYVQAKLVTVGG